MGRNLAARGAGAIDHHDFIARYGEKCRQDKGAWCHEPIFFSFWLRVNTTRRKLIRGSGAVSIKIRATQEVMAARAAQLALFIVEFMAAARTPAPVFVLDLTRS